MMDRSALPAKSLGRHDANLVVEGCTPKSGTPRQSENESGM